MLLTSCIPSYDLPGLNVKISEKTLRRRILNKKKSPIYNDLEQMLTYMLQNDNIRFYRNEEVFFGHKKTSLYT